MKRRKFLFLVSAGGIATAGTALYASKGFNKVIYNILKEDLKGLKIEESSLEKYIKEAEDEKYWGFTQSKIYFIRAHYNLPIPLPYSFKYKQFRSIIAGTYLMSTDFFLNKMNVELPVKYIAFYNPYKRPCFNPFSSMYYKA